MKQHQIITSSIPKSSEFSYFDIMDKIAPLVNHAYKFSASGLLTFEALLDHLHVQTVHYKKEEECPEECKQKQICGRIQDVLSLVRQVLDEMSNELPILKNVQIVVVGSLKEQTKIGKVDEADLLLTLDEKFEKYFCYDKSKQRLQIWKTNMPSELEQFVLEDNLDSWDKALNTCNFDEEKYFFSFMRSFYEVIRSGNLKLPPGLTLSTNFSPCNVCKIKENKDELFVRCRHEHTCEDHLIRLRNPHHQETCDCRNFTSPCLTFSKIGLVLHLEFKQDDGTCLNLDVDVNPGAIPYKSSFDGSNKNKRKRLEKERYRLVDWKTEWDKTEDNSEICGNWWFTPDDGLKRSVRMRFFNFRDVISEEV